MFILLKQELSGFLSSLIGYITIIVFLSTVSLFLWVFPNTEFNILDNGYSSIESLFIIAPWVFMFLIPAITMRSFAEEKKTGTIEILFTQPLSELQVITAKYFAGLLLVIFSLLPTLLFYIIVSYLSLPPGIDTGGMWGSYIGLLFLGAGFVSIGISSSSISDNQIVSFIIAMFLCFFFYIGFDSISSVGILEKFDNIIQLIGINSHYVSMSRGVIDTRDVLYFISLICFFILLTKTVLRSRKW